MDTAYFNSPVGWLVLQATESHICGLCRIAEPPEDEIKKGPTPSALLQMGIRQLEEYFEGRRTVFELPLKQTGTPFQQKVWDELQNIPYGERISYQELARRTRNPKACRAVGSANGRNRICILIPCHRVVQSDGSIGGYAYGPEMKQFLLDLETT